MLKAQKTKLVFFSACVLTALVLIVTQTYAWFTAEDEKVNQFITDKIVVKYEFDSKLFDDFDPDPDGDVYTKRVGAVVSGNRDSFVRLLVIPTFVDDSDPNLPPIVLPAVFGTHIILDDGDYNTTNWAYGGDGYYYYLGVLKPGDSTDDMGQNLFNTVKLADNLPPEYENAHLVIEVKCEASGTEKWDYRAGWWGSEAAISDNTSPLYNIDATLALLAKNKT